MKVDVLVSTMNEVDKDLIERMNINFSYVVINQCGRDSEESLSTGKWINSSNKGLSKSRNLALKNSEADICLLADDDLIYLDDCEKRVLREFINHPEADIIAFQVEGINKEFKKYNSKVKQLNYISTMKVSSVEIAFRRKRIAQAGLTFNELFGSGSKYYSGEESIFLYNALKKGLKVYYIPVKIADLHLGDSTWFEGYTKRYFLSKGAAYSAMSRTFSHFLIFQFALRKHKYYRKEISFVKVLKLLRKGRMEYLTGNTN